VAVQVFPAFRRRAPVRLLRDATRAALAVGGAVRGASAKVGVVVADDETVRALNAQYRGLDETTDVLSFSWEGQCPFDKLRAGSSPSTPKGSGEAKGKESRQGGCPVAPSSDGFPLMPSSVVGLGEVIISYPQAERQAREHGHATRDELALLVVHGVLHLQGYDHEEAGDEARMRALESRALAGLGIGLTLIGRTLLERSGHGG
jgi:probable rRNA maturation factor